MRKIKNKKKKERKKREPNQETNAPMITNAKNYAKKKKKNGQTEPYDKW